MTGCDSDRDAHRHGSGNRDWWDSSRKPSEPKGGAGVVCRAGRILQVETGSDQEWMCVVGKSGREGVPDIEEQIVSKSA